jgi:hypothetical protein
LAPTTKTTQPSAVQLTVVAKHVVLCGHDQRRWKAAEVVGQCRRDERFAPLRFGRSG